MTNRKKGLAEARFKKAKPEPNTWEQAYSELAQKSERLRAQRLAKEVGGDPVDQAEPAEPMNPVQAPEND